MNPFLVIFLLCVVLILWNVFSSESTIAKNSYPGMYDKPKPEVTSKPKRDSVEEIFLQIIMNLPHSSFIDIKNGSTYPVYCVMVNDRMKGVSVDDHMGQRSGGYLYIVDFKTINKSYIELNDEELLYLKNKFSTIKKEFYVQQKNNNLNLFEESNDSKNPNLYIN